MRIFLCPNTDEQKHIDAARAVAQKLSAIGVEWVSAPEHAGLFADIPTAGTAAAQSGAYDMLAAVGGDGTMLKSAQLALAADRPIFGINAGRIGFLAAFDLADFLGSATAEELAGMAVSERVLLDIALASAPERHYFAVNEVVVSRANRAKTAEIAIQYGGSHLGTLRCDGVIAATPTGATGYSLSAGGPIVEPTLNAVIVTPICAHSLFSRSYVLADGKTISIRPVERVHNEAFVSSDGNLLGEIDYRDEVLVAKSDRTLKLLSSSRRNFYDLLYNEISERR